MEGAGARTCYIAVPLALRLVDNIRKTAKYLVASMLLYKVQAIYK